MQRMSVINLNFKWNTTRFYSVTYARLRFTRIYDETFLIRIYASFCCKWTKSRAERYFLLFIRKRAIAFKCEIDRAGLLASDKNHGITWPSSGVSFIISPKSKRASDYQSQHRITLDRGQMKRPGRMISPKIEVSITFVMLVYVGIYQGYSWTSAI